MGARINYVIQDGSDTAVVLYSHWGADGWEYELTQALAHAEPRLDDYSYATRMIISSLIDQSSDELMSQTGFGIYAVTVPFTLDMFDEAVVIDLSKKTVNDVAFDVFMAGVSA